MTKQNKHLNSIVVGEMQIKSMLLYYNHQTGKNFQRAITLIAGGQNGLWICKMKQLCGKQSDKYTKHLKNILINHTPEPLRNNKNRSKKYMA